MTESHTYQIVTLPKLQDGPGTEAKVQHLARKFRELRLNSLEVASDAFASTFESESARGLDQTVDRLAHPKAVQFIALRKPKNHHLNRTIDLERILESDWVGMIVLWGPEEENGLSIAMANLDPYQRMTAPAKDLLYDGSSHRDGRLHFHLNGTFVDPSARGGGLGKALVDAALRYAKAEAARTNVNLQVTLSVYSHNVAARRTYEKAGFRLVKEAVSRSKSEFMALHMELLLAAAA